MSYGLTLIIWVLCVGQLFSASRLNVSAMILIKISHLIHHIYWRLYLIGDFNVAFAYFIMLTVFLAICGIVEVIIIFE